MRTSECHTSWGYECVFLLSYTVCVYVVQALKDIAKTLGKTNWNFSADPCSGEYGWITQADKYNANNVTCGHCTTSDAANATGTTDQICHVVSMYVPLSLSLSLVSSY